MQYAIYLVEGYFAGDETILRNQILRRYPGFYRGPVSSPSKEVRILARMVKDDPRSTTCRNLRYLRQMSMIQQVEIYSSWRVKEALGMEKVLEHVKWKKKILVLNLCISSLEGLSVLLS